MITGGIQRLGQVVRITARLIDVSDSRVIRTVKIDGTVDQIIRIQKEVASQLSDSVTAVTS